jgi:hypothetical protein
MTHFKTLEEWRTYDKLQRVREFTKANRHKMSRRAMLGGLLSVGLVAPTFAQIVQFSGAPASGGGGGSCYDNVNNWPSTSNRPSVSGSTISWIGPTSGGASTTCDTAQSHAISSVGSQTFASAGATNEYLDISGTVYVNAANVTLRRSRISGDSSTGMIQLNGTTATGFTLEDCVVDGANITNTGWLVLGNNHSGGLDTPTGLTIRRNNMSGSEQCVGQYYLGSMTFIDNYCHDMYCSDGDMVEMYGTPTGTALLIQHNYFDGTNHSGGTLNSLTNMSNHYDQVVAQLINNAYVSPPNWDIDSNSSFTADPVNFEATSNGFYNRSFGRNTAGSHTTVSPNASNFAMATATALSGSALNGTGQV